MREMYQIVVRRPDAKGHLGKWEFIAHGARYDASEVAAWAKRAEGRGYVYVTLPL